MSRRARLWGVFAAASVLALALLAPLRLVLDAFAAGLPIAARDVSGSLWTGQLRGARWGTVPLDSLDLRLRPLPLLYGQQHWALAGERIVATVVRGRTSGLRDVGGELALAWPAWPDAGPRLRLDEATLLFRDGRCAVAAGRLSLELQPPAAAADDNAVEPPAIRLDGRPSCAGAGARVEFAPGGSLPAGIDRVAIAVDIDAAGRYRARTAVRTAAPELRLALQAQGFEENAADLTRDDRGQLLR